MTFSKLSRSLVRLIPACLLCAAAFAINGDQVLAQSYVELPLAEKYQMVEIPEDAENSRELKNLNKLARTARKSEQKAIQAILLAGGDANVPATQEYFDGYVFPSMTMATNLANAGKLRYDFDRAYLGTKYQGASRAPFIQGTLLPGLQKLAANDQLSPAARVNAVVMISRLDDSPLVRTAKRAPRPSLVAFDSLISIWQGDSPEYLKAAAFSGILRHMEVDDAVTSPRIPNDRKSQLMQAVTSAVDAILAEDPELKVDLNRWKVSKSVELMSKSRLPGEASAYFDRMSAMLNKDSKIPKWVKLEAVRGLTRLSMSSLDPAKANSLVESAALYASTSLGEEANGLQKRVDNLIYDNILWSDTDLEVTGTNYTDDPKSVGGGMLGGGMGSMGSMGGGGGMMGGAMSGGGMMGGGPGMDDAAPGSPFDSEEMAAKPIVELPNYELNLSRRRAKLIVFSVQQLLDSDTIKKSVTDKHKAGLDPLKRRIDEFMEKDSNIGVIDLAKSGDKEKQKKSYADQLKEAFKEMSGEIAGSVAKMRGERAPAAAPAAQAAGAPAADTLFDKNAAADGVDPFGG